MDHPKYVFPKEEPKPLTNRDPLPFNEALLAVLREIRDQLERLADIMEAKSN
jgi:hypothetical protein